MTISEQVQMVREAKTRAESIEQTARFIMKNDPTVSADEAYTRATSLTDANYCPDGEYLS